MSLGRVVQARRNKQGKAHSEQPYETYLLTIFIRWSIEEVPSTMSSDNTYFINSLS